MIRTAIILDCMGTSMQTPEEEAQMIIEALDCLLEAWENYERTDKIVFIP